MSFFYVSQIRYLHKYSTNPNTFEFILGDIKISLPNMNCFAT